MRKVLLLSILLIAQSVFAGKPKMLIVGDSWASFMCLYGSFKTVLRKKGYADRIRGDRRSAIPAERRTTYDYHIDIEGCGKTTKLGTTTEDFLKGKWKNRVVERASDEDVKIIFISLGGNDLIDNWHNDMSVDEEYEIFESVLTRTQQIISYIREVNSHAKIIISHYDYPNFESFSGLFNFKKLYKEMGSPSPYRINEALTRFASYMTQINTIEDVEFIHHLGLMHYYYGNKKKGLERYATAAPEDISPPDDPSLYGGEVELESSKRAFSRIPIIYGDNYHLSRTGFKRLVEHTFDHYLTGWVNQTLDQ